MNGSRGGLQPPKKVVDATEGYRVESDHAARFLDECVAADPGGKVKASTLYGRYCRWCEVNNERAISGTMFGLRMGAEGYAKQKSTYVHYLGMKLRDADS